VIAAMRLNAKVASALQSARQERQILKVVYLVPETHNLRPKFRNLDAFLGEKVMCLHLDPMMLWMRRITGNVALNRFEIRMAFLDPHG